MFRVQTEVGLDGIGFLVNGERTYTGCGDIEGFLFNVRTVNATFDDTLGKVGWFDDDGTVFLRLQNDDAYGARYGGYYENFIIPTGHGFLENLAVD